MTETLKAIEGMAAAVDLFTTKVGQRIDGMDERLEKIEAANDRPRVDSEKGHTREQLEHKARFVAWMREPHGHQPKNQLAEAESEFRQKSVSGASGASGGFAVPAIIASEIEKRVRIQNPFRSLVRVVPVGTPNYTHLVSKNSAAYEWVGEGDSRSETATSDLLSRAPTFGTLSAYPKASEESLNDVFFNVEEWLTDEVSDAFSEGEAQAIWNGNGTKRPTGLINTSPSSTSDTASPERNASALQYLPLPATSSPHSFNALDGLINVLYAVKSQYLQPADGVAWVMRRSTAGLVRKLKDTDSQFIWQPSAQAGQPATLLGYPVAETDAVDAYAANGYFAAFGNWRRAYLLAVIHDLRITVDANITTPGQVKFYCRRRLGGTVLNNHCVKLLKYAAS